MRGYLAVNVDIRTSPPIVLSVVLLGVAATRSTLPGQERALGSRATAPGGAKRVRWGHLCPWEARSYTTRRSVPASCTHAPRGADASGHGAHTCEAIATGRRCSSYRKIPSVHANCAAGSMDSMGRFIRLCASARSSASSISRSELLGRGPCTTVTSREIDIDRETPFQDGSSAGWDSPQRPYPPQPPESLFYLLL